VSDIEVTDVVDAQILPRQPLTLIPLGDSGAASCEGDSCAI